MPNKTKRSRAANAPPKLSDAPATPKPRAKSASIEVDTDLEWLRPQADANPKHTQALTERVFDSALAKHGWVRNHRGELEHVGASAING